MLRYLFAPAALLLQASLCASYFAAAPPRVSKTCRTGTPAGMSSAATPPAGRRSALQLAAAAAALHALPDAAQASGGATAGKYTTIPIAKRRYFGRVKEGVFELLAMQPALKQGDLKSEDITNFFSQNLKTQSKRQKRNCLSIGDGSGACEVKEEVQSRWQDMQTSMFLLGNAFRLDSGKPPEKVRQVKEAKAFFKEVNKLESAAQQGNKKAAALAYAAAIDALDVYLNDVELPPTEDSVYRDSADQRVPSLCQGSFCI